MKHWYISTTLYHATPHEANFQNNSDQFMGHIYIYIMGVGIAVGYGLDD
jgi:hypothetical protein